MEKQRTQTASSKGSKNASSGRYKVLGTLPDGVKILAPKSKPTNFTTKEIKATIQELRRNSKIGGSVKVEGGRG
jgi:hypothetical protein